MSILVIGSIALDTIKTPFRKVCNILGGSASYFAVSAAFFSPVRMVAVVGRDFPSRFIDFFNRKRIDTKGIEVDNSGRTFRWEGEYGSDFGDVKTIKTELNVFEHFIPTPPKSYRDSKYIFLANIDPDLQKSLISYLNKPSLLAFDTMNYWIEHKRSSVLQVLNNMDIFLVNAAEARQLTGEYNLIKSAKSILRLGPKIVVIKKGENGSLLFSGDFIFSIPAFPMENVCDPTGAGDSFAGGMFGYIAKCNRVDKTVLKDGLIYGTIMASFAIEDFGLKKISRINHIYIRKRLAEFKKIVRV